MVAEPVAPSNDGAMAMSRQRDQLDNGSWVYAQELFGRGDPAFIDEIRRITDADRLGDFATAWYADQRPAARHFLLTYLDRPLNAFRHEALVKRLFKLADQANDEEVMGWFLVALDRSVRRAPQQVRHFEFRTLESRQAAQELLTLWQGQGWRTNLYHWGDHFQVHGLWFEEKNRVPRSRVVWRPKGKDAHRPYPIDERFRKKLERGHLFRVATRRYLRRRAWRFFRKLGKQQPERYVSAVAAALKRYEDADVTDGLALLDNWGLMHILFHHSPAVRATRRDWEVAEGQSLSGLAPAPMYEPLWKVAPRALLDLLKEGRCRPVRQWAIFMLRRDYGASLKGMPTEELFTLLGHDAFEVVALAAEVLRQSASLSPLGLNRWLALLGKANPQALDIICDLMASRLQPDALTLSEIASLAGSRPLPVARLGFDWLRTKRPASEEDCRALLRLADAEAAPLRPEMLRWVRSVLSPMPSFKPVWTLELLDSRHADARAEGWRWLAEDPRVGDDVEIWQKLLESPYDDIRLNLIRELERRTTKKGVFPSEAGELNEERVRTLWASVLLDIHRGGRIKPLAVAQVVRRLTRRPGEAALLLPILAVALRSLRGPEWRTGLTAVVRLIEGNSDLRPIVQRLFPELTVAE
jgi:hypothetical protein